MSLSVCVKKQLGAFCLDVSFEVEKAQEILALLGPSGCGKSMTLKCIAGVVTPDEGRIVLNGRVLFDSAARVNLRPQERRVGYLFQNYALFPNMSVEENIGSGVLRVSREERAARVAEQVKRFRLEGLERKRPAQLSGGQQQRVALARIMASRPELLLLDEPFSALDGYLRWQLELELADTLHEFAGGTVFVSHSRDEVYRMCDTVCVVSAGASEPKVSVPELFCAPSTLAAAQISGCKNVSRAQVAGGQAGDAGVGAGAAPATGAVVDAAVTALECLDWGVTLETTLPVSAGVTHVGVRAHYFEVVGTDGVFCEKNNVFTCGVDRVIDNVFSTIVMLRTPAGALLRYECDKGAWAALENPREVGLRIAPECVMPLCDGAAASGSISRVSDA